MNIAKIFKIVVMISVLAVMTIGPAMAQDENGEYRMGIVTPRGIMSSHKQWRVLGRYISEVVGKRVNLVHMPPALLRESAKLGNLDFVFANPTLVITLRDKLGFQPVSTVKRKKTGAEFGGVIVAKKGAGITKAEDLRGKSVRYFRKASAAAYLFQVYHLLEKGIDPKHDLGSFEQQPNARKQDEIVMAVVKGEADVGFVKTGLIEAMVREGTIKMDDIVIVDQQKSNYPQVHSTVLYPEWTVAASKNLDSDLVARVRAALAKLSKDDEAAKLAGIDGFEDPLDLSNLKRAMVAVQEAAESG